MSELIVETREMEVGIKNLKKITIYPLSFAAQKKFAGKIAELIEEFSKQAEDDESSTLKMVNLIIGLLEENIVEISNLVTEDDIDLENVTNDQILDLCTNIYEMNYEGAGKKVKKLMENVKSLWKNS